MAATIYLLCAGTALTCCLLLLRGFHRTRVPLLFWSGLCFGIFTADNVFLFLDRIVFPAVDFTYWRMFLAPVGVGLLLYGMIWKSK